MSYKYILTDSYLEVIHILLIDINYFLNKDDVVMGTLTVRENLHFSAALRLPKNFRYQDREARVQMIISDLGLNNCSETKVRINH